MELIVGRPIHQVSEWCGIRDGQLDQPALTVRITVHEGGVVGDVLVHFRDRTCDHADHVRGRLHGLDFTDRTALRDLRAGGQHLDVGDVGEFIRGMLGDADGDRVALEEAHKKEGDEKRRNKEGEGEKGKT